MVMAPIFAAMAASSSAKEQAKADKYIADKQAAASIEQTKMQQEATLALSRNQRELSEKQLAVTTQLAQEQAEREREETQTQISLLLNEQRAQAAERAEIRAIEQSRIDQQIAFAKEQAAENLRLAKLTINTQLVQQGLATGQAAAAGARGRLTVGGGQTQTAAAAQASQPTFADAIANGLPASGNPTARAVAGDYDTAIEGASLSKGLSGFVPTGRAVTGQSQSVALAKPQATQKTSSSALLSSVKKSSSLVPVGGSSSSNSKFPGFNRIRAVGKLSNKGFALAPNSGPTSALSKVMRGISRGLMSTRGAPNKITEKKSDLQQAIAAVADKQKRVKQRFTDYYAQDQAVNQSKKNSHSFRGAHRPPATTSLERPRLGY